MSDLQFGSNSAPRHGSPSPCHIEGPMAETSSSDKNKGNMTPSESKKQEKCSIVELKNGKVLFKQKPISFEKQSETLQGIVKFREMLEERVEKKEPPLIAFPEDHKPVIAKLAHESDKTITFLSKHIHQELLPTSSEGDDSELLAAATATFPVALVEDAIKSVLVRKNYGLEAPLGVKIPSLVCVWRWEVRPELMHWLPRNSQDKVLTRQAERVQAQEYLQRLFNDLPKEERDSIIDTKHTAKVTMKELTPLNNEETVANADEAKPPPMSAKKQGKKKAEEPENDQSDSKVEKSKKPQDPEKTAKERERLEKKAARQEKERREKEAQNKSKSLMANFFTKTKTAARPKEVEASSSGPSKQQSDFERVFKPFVLHKDKVLAPINYFADAKRRNRSSIHNHQDIIIIEDEDDVEMVDPQPTQEELALLSPAARLKDILSSLPRPSNPSLPRKPNQMKASLQWKTYHPVSVRDLMAQLSEAEIAGDDNAVRLILKKLDDRSLLPAKVLIFHVDTRPGYFGTWTRCSKIIGPRTPFAKDTILFDYGHDSGEEWEEEPQGEDVVADDEDDDGDDEDPDSDLESWLVDDDEVPEVSIHERDLSPPPFLDIPPQPPKRKADDGEKKLGKRRKVVVPLVPFARGPCWETTVGKAEYQPFVPYSIQLFNDTPFPIDPFTYVSTCIEDHKASLRVPQQGQPTATEPVFAVPALPPRLADSNGVSASSSPVPITKKAPVTSKFPFPDTHLAFLLDKIEQLQATSITSLVESIYLELREHKVKKVSIEAKVREVGEKCKEKKVWVVKPSLKQVNPVS